MSGKQEAYAAKRRGLTHAQLTAWCRRMLDLGEVTAPPAFNCQQDAPEADGEAPCRCAGGADPCGLCHESADAMQPCSCCGGTGREMAPDATLHTPGPLRDAWMAGRDAAAYAALRAAARGKSALAVAARAALAMPSDEVEV